MRGDSAGPYETVTAKPAERKLRPFNKIPISNWISQAKRHGRKYNLYACERARVIYKSFPNDTVVRVQWTVNV